MVRADLTAFFEKILDLPNPSEQERRDQLGLCKVVLELCTVENLEGLFPVEYHGLSLSEALRGAIDLFAPNPNRGGGAARLAYAPELLREGLSALWADPGTRPEGGQVYLEVSCKVRNSPSV